MARRAKGRPIDGWLVFDKPFDMTSTAAVGALKRMFDARKVGHAGTLDPLATGILPIAFGEATKTVPFIVDGAKSYRFTVQFGHETTTDDAEGEVCAEGDTALATRDAITAALPNFHGTIQQIPPKFSAIKIKGERAYDKAREGEEFEVPPREVRIDRLELVTHDPATATAVFEADCGKGTYVRAIARDIGRATGACGHVTALRRTRVGPFTELGAFSLEKLETLSHKPEQRVAPLESLLPVEAALDDIPALSIGNDDASRLRQGRSVLIRGRDAPTQTGPVYAMSRGKLVAVGEIAHGELRPQRVFNISAMPAA